MCLVSTDTRLDKLLSSIVLQSCLVELLLSWSVSVPSCAAAFKCDYILVNPKHFQCLKISRGLEILSSLAVSRWLIFLAPFTISILISLVIFAKILDVRIFIIFKKRSILLRKKYLHMGGGAFFIWKYYFD